MSDLTPLKFATNTATGQAYAHGAHVTQWQPTGHQPVLWVSPQAVFAHDKAIRGGIPVCFPWFNAHPDDPAKPNHGTVRTQAWSVTQQTDHAVTFTTQAPAVDVPLDDTTFAVSLTVTFGDSLNVSFTATNPSNTPASFEVALHTYLAVADVRHIKVTGLKNRRYLDQLTGETLTQDNPEITFDAETDRVYHDTPDTVNIHDPKLNRRITLEKTGSMSTVVWNPWDAKAQRMSDFPDDAWPHMLCIETANIGPDAVTLEPGASHTMTLTITVDIP